MRCKEEESGRSWVTMWDLWSVLFWDYEFSKVLGVYFDCCFTY